MGQFVDRWAKAEHMNAKLGVALVSISAVSIVLVFTLAYIAVKPRPIYYIPGAWEAGVAAPQSTPQMTAAIFVSSWVLNWTNFTPVTVQEVYVRAQRFMSPYLLAKTRASLDKDIDQVKHDNISSLFSITKEPSVAVEKTGFLITLQGDKGVYVGKEQVSTQRMTYHIRVRMMSPTENNPYGFMIEAIDEEAVS